MRRKFILNIAILTIFAATGFATQTRFWQADTQADFSCGKVKQIRITEDGTLKLAPNLKQIIDVKVPFIFCSTRDKSGNLYLGTGHGGKVFRVDSTGKMVLVFKADEPDIFSLASTPDGTLFIGAGPGGKIYRLTPDGNHSLVVDLKCKYIWSLLVGRDGTVYASTGVEGKIFKIVRNKASVFYDSNQVHIMCMSFDLDGNIIAGTVPDGYVLKIDPSGKAESLFDSPNEEVHSVVVDRYGAVYVLCMGKTGTSIPTGKVAVLSISAKEQNKKKKKKEKKSDNTIQFTQIGKDGTKAEGNLFRIDKKNRVQLIWSSKKIKAYSLWVAPDGRVYLGTDDSGRVLEIDDNRAVSVVAETDEAQVTALIRSFSGIDVLTSNLGKVFELVSSRSATGTFISDVIDTGFISKVGTLHAVVRGDVKFYIRGGNTDEPDKTWMKWTQLLKSSESDMWAINIARYRYFQIKATLSSTSQYPPEVCRIGRIDISYVQQNQAPHLTKITVNPAGILYRTQIVAPSAMTGLPGYGKKSTIKLPDYIRSSFRRGNLQMQVQMPKIYRRGAVSLSWRAFDPNGDILEYSVWVKKSTENKWTLLGKNLNKNYFNLPSFSIPDGKYIFRVDVSDQPSNPGDSALMDKITSKLYIQDTTPPKILIRSFHSENGVIYISFTIKDSLSTIYKVEISTDGGNSWQGLLPEDGLNDETCESFKVKVTRPSNDVHMVIVRAMDYSGNVGCGSVYLK